MTTEGLIGRRHDAKYNLGNRPAEYFLLAKGIAALRDAKVGDQMALKNLYKDKSASDSFVHHNLALARIYCRLRPEGLRFLTKIQTVNLPGFPDPRPDGFLAYNGKYYFLEYLSAADPFFVTLHRRSKRFIEYSESGDWEIGQKGTALPTVLLVFETEALFKRTGKALTQLLKNSWDDDLKFSVTTISEIMQKEMDAPVWHLLSEEENKPVPFQSID
jgi:hypothetical protein